MKRRKLCHNPHIMNNTPPNASTPPAPIVADEPSTLDDTDADRLRTQTLQTTPETRPTFFRKISKFFKGINRWADSVLEQKQDTNIREALEEIIEEDSGDEQDEHSVSAEERLLISNILQLRNNEVEDVMLPRADITAIDVNTTHDELLAFMKDIQFSRFPVFRDSLDDVIGTIHIKDIMSAISQEKTINIQELVRSVPIVSPSMPVLDLLLHMRESRKHMAMVVDEYGGIDGLVTIGDVIESIVGELDDEHDDLDDQPQLVDNKDGSVLADARVHLNEFEARYNILLDEQDHTESDTLGGLVFTIAGRVPVRGEMLKHNSGMEFEVIDADPRRIHRLQIRNIPAQDADDA